MAEGSDDEDQAEVDAAWNEELDQRRASALANGFADALTMDELFQQLELRRKPS